MLAALLPDGLPAHLVPPELGRAMQDQSEDNILAVRTFLANAGNVVQTGTDLHLHRTTVYYRLSRFAETTGLDLADGDTRLMLQLWFRMAPYVRIDEG
jgi:DNA-binding PucR family transcriptional regulator